VAGALVALGATAAGRCVHDADVKASANRAAALFVIMVRPDQEV
jgi:hypothetical protein